MILSLTERKDQETFERLIYFGRVSILTKKPTGRDQMIDQLSSVGKTQCRDVKVQKKEQV
jgi:hypothetical protein